MDDKKAKLQEKSQTEAPLQLKIKRTRVRTHSGVQTGIAPTKMDGQKR